MKIVWIVCGVLMAMAALWLYLIAPRLKRPGTLRELKNWKFAHRGLHDIKKGVPENSLHAFRLACEQGFGMELDVRLSRDGRLVVLHDDTLRRTCGIDGPVEDTDWATLKQLRLEGTDEPLPLLEDVFRLVAGRVPLLIEAKVFRGNHGRLCPALWQALQTYSGPYCIESFDPRALLWFRRHAPQAVRGQLVSYIRRDGTEIARFLDFGLRNLWVNVISRPDFVAYNYLHRRNLSFQLCRRLFRPPVFYWTIRSVESANLAVHIGAAQIFEQIEPSS